MLHIDGFSLLVGLLLALSTRQAMGALDFTILQDSAGNWNTSDVKAFLRSAGGIGSGGYVLSLTE